MRPSRASERVARTLPKREIEERLDDLLRRGGESALQRLRDGARGIAAQLGMPHEFARLDALIGTLFGSRRSPLESPIARPRRGLPYDPHRLDLFQRLHADWPPPPQGLARHVPARAGFAFSSVLLQLHKGTEFAVDEAVDIVFNGHIPKARPADAHDVLGTWKVVSNEREMSPVRAALKIWWNC